MLLGDYTALVAVKIGPFWCLGLLACTVSVQNIAGLVQRSFHCCRTLNNLNMLSALKHATGDGRALETWARYAPLLGAAVSLQSAFV